MPDEPVPPSVSPQPTMPLNSLSASIIRAAMDVHTELGPGLLESVYETCLAHELIQRGFSVIRQHPLPVVYKGVELDERFRLDLVVESAVVVEVKSVVRLQPVHEAQFLSYLRLSRLRLGLLFNFNVRHLRQGIRRRLNGY